MRFAMHICVKCWNLHPAWPPCLCQWTGVLRMAETFLNIAHVHLLSTKTAATHCNRCEQHMLIQTTTSAGKPAHTWFFLPQWNKFMPFNWIFLGNEHVFLAWAIFFIFCFRAATQSNLRFLRSLSGRSSMRALRDQSRPLVPLGP